MGKFKILSAQQFLKKKRIFGPIKDPVWVYIKREMKQNAQRKPHQSKVLHWLRFLRDLRYHYYCEAKKQYNRLCRQCGPDWFMEYSTDQRNILGNLKAHIHEDILEDLPTRVRKDLWDLGITLRFSNVILMEAMNLSYGDAGIFLWRLYEMFYKKSPTDIQRSYDLNAMLMMSALTFIDIEECIMELEKLTTRGTNPPEPIPKKKTSHHVPRVRYGEYLQQLRVPLYSTHPASPPKPKKPLPIACRIKIRSQETYDRLMRKTGFLEKRKIRNVKEKLKERVCKYKFWEPPALFGSDKKTADLVLKMKMLKKSARARHMKQKPPFDNIQCIISGVVFIKNKPVYMISSFVTLPSHFLIINEGLSKFGDEYVTRIGGMWNIHKEIVQKCNKSCNCVKKWYPTVMDHLQRTKCNCGHLYDFDVDTARLSTERETLFYPPGRNTPFLFDHAKIYQLDTYVEFINKTFKKALASESTIVSSASELDLFGLSNSQLLQMFLADLTDTALLIPHLPQAHRLNRLLEWVRQRVRGKTSPAQDKRLMLKTQRRWMELGHLDFRARAYYIPFTLKQVQNMDWSHRKMIQEVSVVLLRNFEMRTRREMLEHARLFWGTMMNDVYPSKPFLNAFFSYMPGRIYDTLVVNPYSVQNTPTSGAKTCSLTKPL